ncbi:MAG: hypothetical protein AB1603_03830 [Chloroflexota bacterium]
MAIVADSTLLIGMARIGRLELLKRLYGRALVPPSVHEEVVVEGKRLHKAGAGEVEKAIQSGWIKVTALTRDQLSKAEAYRASGGIGRGEAEAIALARGRGLPVIVDDRYARGLAGTLGLEFMGTAAVLLEAHWRGLLSKREFAESLRELAKVTWLSPEVVAELLRLAEEGKQ